MFPRLSECLNQGGAPVWGMELVQSGISWRAGRCLIEARERVAAMLARTRWMGSPHSLPPSQVVSPMSDEWMREFENGSQARGGDNR